MDDYEIPAFLRKSEGPRAEPAFDEDSFTPEQMLQKFNELSVTTPKFSDITWELTERVSQGYIWKVLCDMSASKDEIDTYWACLLWWLAHEVPGICALTRHSERMLLPQMKVIEASLIEEVAEQLKEAFPSISRSSWGHTSATEKRSLLTRFKKLMTGG